MTRLFTAIVLYCLSLGVVTANTNLSVSIEHWLADTLSAKNIEFGLSLHSHGLGMQFTASELKLPDDLGKIKHLALDCQHLVFYSEQYQCKQGTLSFVHPELGKQTVGLEFTINSATEHYRIHVSDISLADGSIELDINWLPQQWQANITTKEIDIIQAKQLISGYLDETVNQILSSWDSSGLLNFTLGLSGKDTAISQAKLTVSPSQLSVSDSEGRYVAESLTWTMHATLNKHGSDWDWQTNLTLDGGEAYIEPIFFDIAATPIQLAATGKWQQDNSISIDAFDFEQSSVLKINGTARILDNKLSSSSISLDTTEIDALYTHWLQPMLPGTSLNSLDLAGQIQAHYTSDHDNYQIQIDLDDIYLDDQAQKFGIDALSGQLAWTNTASAMTTKLNWQGGYVYAVPIGSSSFIAESASSNLTLTQPWQLPIFDGELELEQLSLHHPQGEETTWSFKGNLKPISMTSLSNALGWPALKGKLSGSIPKVSYSNKRIDMDGELSVNIFGGNTTISELKLNSPFGTLPQLYANIDLKQLDLETITSTFDFGKITGKLDGSIHNLRLSNWQPVQFDAKFATPAGDKSRRKISQRAVDNLSQIGGGASGVLSRSFLRFFEDFSYQRLGLNCLLINNVCEMSGVGEAENGYYLVKGGGLPPRINVVGYTRRVDWADLIDRLKAVQNSSGPIIQ